MPTIYLTVECGHEGAAQRKREKHQERCEEYGLLFKPIVVASTGGWGDDAGEAVKGVARVMARNQDREEGEVIRHAFQRLSMAVMRGNGNMLASRMRSTLAEVDGVL